MTGPTSWQPVHQFVHRLLAGRTTTVIAGTPEWCALPDDHPDKATAVLIAGSRWVLETELEENRQHREVLNDAALTAQWRKEWAAVAQAIRDRDAWYRSNPDLQRKKVS